MLLATYQSEILVKENIELMSTLSSILGYMPYICFDANTPQNAIIESILFDSEKPEILYFIETDEYDYIDIIEWNLYIKTKDISHIQKGLNNKCEKIFRRYLINQNLITKDTLYIKIEDAVYGESQIDFSQIFGYNEDVDFETAVNDIYKRLAQSSLAFVINSITKDKEEIYSLRKKAFEMHLLGMYAHLANPNSMAEGVYMMNIPAYMKHFYEIHNNIISMYDESASIKNITYDSYLKLYEKINSLTWNIIWGDIPERNSLCPCCSGKKFKKCHGRYI